MSVKVIGDKALERELEKRFGIKRDGKKFKIRR